MSSSESSACFALLLIIVLNSSKSICPFPSVSTSPRKKVLGTNSLLRRRTSEKRPWTPDYHIMKLFLGGILTNFSQDSSQIFCGNSSIAISMVTSEKVLQNQRDRLLIFHFSRNFFSAAFLSMRSKAALYSDTEVLLLASILPILDMARMLSRLVVIFEIIWVMILLYWSKTSWKLGQIWATHHKWKRKFLFCKLAF